MDPQREGERLVRGPWGYPVIASLGLGLAGSLLFGRDCRGQDLNLRLTVRPHEMAMGTRTAHSGVSWLDVPTHNPVYVPGQCVGTRRCPLVLASNSGLAYVAPAADRYGFIVLIISGEGDAAEVASLNVAIPRMLQTYAIDPDRIAIVGRCATGLETATYGTQNLDVFSRVVVFTQDFSDPPPPRRISGRTTEYYVAGGLVEGGATFRQAQQLRDLGYPVKHSLQFRGHTFQREDYDFMGRWLQESWAIPDPAARPKPYTFGDPPLLTDAIIAKLDAFWTRFLQEPDSIKTTARRALVREVIVPVGPEQISTLMVDMAALAAQYPSVASDLKAAGLTAQQHDAYRAALASARIVKSNASDGNVPPVPVGPASAWAKNAAFMKTHPDDFPVQNSSVAGRTPGITAMWSMP